MSYAMKIAQRTGAKTENIVDEYFKELGFQIERPVGQDKGIDRLIYYSNFPNKIAKIQVKGRGASNIKTPRWFQLTVPSAWLRKADEAGTDLNDLWKKRIYMVDFWVMVSVPKDEIWIFPSKIVHEIADANALHYPNRKDNDYTKLHYRNGKIEKKQKELNLDKTDANGVLLHEKYNQYKYNHNIVKQFLTNNIELVSEEVKHPSKTFNIREITNKDLEKLSTIKSKIKGLLGGSMQSQNKGKTEKETTVKADFKNFSKQKILIIDLETTGFLKQGGKIVEIGIVKLNTKTGKIKPVFNSLIQEDGFNKEHKSSPFGWIFKNSDLNYKDVLKAPSLEEVRLEIQELLNKYHATAFNKAFDFGFLKDRGFIIQELECPMIKAAPICNIPYPSGRKGNKNPNVEEAWQYFVGNKDYTEKHRGLDDAKHEAQIVYELIKMGEFELPQETKISLEGSYFTSIHNIQSILLKALDTARAEIKVAVAWLTDEILFDKLIEKQRQGVRTEIIITNHEINLQAQIDYKKIVDFGGRMYYYGDNLDGLMHNKFCIIDKEIICMGSYNWTYSAKSRNMECLDITDNAPQKAEGYLAEFERIKEISSHL